MKLVPFKFQYQLLRKKNQHAVVAGRKGGKAGTGKAKARTSEQARLAVMVRWAKWRAAKSSSR